MLLSFSRVVFPSDAQYIVLCTTTPRVASCHWVSLSSSCHHFVLSEVVIGVGLSLDVCALGFGVLSRMLVRFDGWAFVLDGADPFGELDGQGVLVWFSSVTFRTGVRFAMLSVFAHWICSA